MLKRFAWINLVLLALCCDPLSATNEPTAFLTLNHNQFTHGVGRDGHAEWEVDYRRDKPGYPLLTPQDPLLLDHGTFRFTFYTRRGNYPTSVWLQAALPVFRLEIWDQTTNELVNQRELQWNDFSGANEFEPRWMELSLVGREGHYIEPKVFWYGLCNAAVSHVDIGKYPEVSTGSLALKAKRLSMELREHQLQNGFVVSRKTDGEPDETGDATTYSGYYTAALAWEYGVTKDTNTLRALESVLQKLHETLRGSVDQPMLSRYVDENDEPHPNTPSKDVYTSFFLAHSVAYPFITNPRLKKQMKDDLLRITTSLVDNDWSLKAGSIEVLSLAPYLTTDEVRSGIQKVMNDKDDRQNIQKTIRQFQKILPWALMPNVKTALTAFENKDEKTLLAMVVPALNNLFNISYQTLNLLKDPNDFFPRGLVTPNTPAKRLQTMLEKGLQKIRSYPEAGAITRLSDMQVLAGNALIALHILRTSAVITKDAKILQYENTNFFTRAALLTCAVNWYGVEEEFFTQVMGNATADRERRGYLSLLSLYNLIMHERNGERKKVYQDLLDRWWGYNQNDDNPMAQAIYALCSNRRGGDIGLILKALDDYPEDRMGLGNAYWKEHGDDIAKKFGGGLNEGYSREPLPTSVRPRDSFLWQRNARRLRGDHHRFYPATDYLFVYWFCRYYKLF